MLDYSFWQRRQRDRCTAIIEAHGRPWRLLVLRPDRETLGRRLVARSTRFDANAAFPITDDVLDAYLRGFEDPQ